MCVSPEPRKVRGVRGRSSGSMNCGVMVACACFDVELRWFQGAEVRWPRGSMVSTLGGGEAQINAGANPWRLGCAELLSEIAQTTKYADVVQPETAQAWRSGAAAVQLTFRKDHDGLVEIGTSASTVMAA